MIDLDFEVRRGSFRLQASLQSDARATGLFGPSGCGKTTLLHALAGIIHPVSGRIVVSGKVFWDGDSGINLSPERRRLGVVFQENRLFPHLDVLGNLLFGYKRTLPAERRLHLDEVASLLGLEPLLSKGVRALSGGEARRVAIGRALLTSPEVLVLDEPLTGLDRRLRDRILAYLIRLKRKLDVRLLYVSHSFSDLAAIADRMALLAVTPEEGLRRSRILKVAPPIELLEEVGDLTGVGPIETVIRGKIAEVDRASGHALVEAEGMRIYAPPEAGPPGTRVVVTLRADEVILAAGEIPSVSTRNVWSGRVSKLYRLETHTVVELDVGRPILAEVTEDSLRRLELDVGREVHALIKSRSIRVASLPAGSHIPSAENP